MAVLSGPLTNKKTSKKINKPVMKSLIAVTVLLTTVQLSFAASSPNNLSNLNSLNNTNTTEVLSFEQAIKLAQENDPWLKGSRYTQTAVESMSNFSATLPDPRISLALANLGTDNFDFEQEAMTQFKVGVSQMFPRGDSLAIKQQQLQIKSRQYPLQRQDRKAKIAVTVGSLWLDAFLAQESIALIEKNYSLFTQLSDVAQASYSSAIGKTRQQDIVRAQLELTRLEDRLVQLSQRQSVFQQRLAQWLITVNSAQDSANLSESAQLLNVLSSAELSLNKKMPSLDFLAPELLAETDPLTNRLTTAVLVQRLMQHPAVKVVDKKIQASASGIELAKQAYRPEWGVNASYGLRGDDATGNNRADLFSVGISFDLPLFTENRQDQLLKAEVSKTEAIKTEKLLLLRQLMSAFKAGKAKLKRLQQRDDLYQRQLLPQIHIQAEASLTAYTHDDGDFSEVVRARIAELNAEIDALSIKVSVEKTILELNYLFINGAVINPKQGLQQQPAFESAYGAK